ncbi:prolipoprotein diacylglyceryl transferase [Simiduia agarivorans]|uniref:Phosphatidylglycerol--prolipoprotein diacylglyceryl transferase n=1 Tax=Simiduia agarivorans (strain DSM 21679 / JCM 13881 / BCRC 17597 / SA1) TaxID=1117647 RepID=K4KL17_SIMAS|nr:prolipoprotein diacylglyceryl transferase [Simiduia agarivorans]AFU99849.1 prolipoprotein diacylglyceryl transferase [Simiduia agarivorans SA1 = DSM 21679]
MKYPEIDPIAFSLGPVDIAGYSLGPLSVHWYGLMYLAAFLAAGFIAARRSTRADSPVTRAQVEDLIMYGAFGVILGGRFGYVLFYNFDRFLADPLWLLRLWEGGMSFHGGLLGVLVALWLYGRRIGQPFFAITDFVAPLVPLGLGFGRLGNFIGQELWGRATDGPWGMVFPRDPEQLARHPSQLYQAALEGLLLFIILFWFSAKPRPRMAVSGLFLLGYGCFRFLVEFVREPDNHISFDLFGWVTRGQVLSAPMIVLGLVFIGLAYRNQARTQQRG